MKINSLAWKLALAFLLVAITTAALVAIFIRLTSVDRLTQFILNQQRSDLSAVLMDYYAENGTWNEVDQDWRDLQFQARPDPVEVNPVENQIPGKNVPGIRSPRSLFGLADANGVVLIPVDDRYPVGSTVPESVIKDGTELSVQGEQVGTLLTAQNLPWLNPEENRFLQQTNEALLYAMGGAMLVALLIGVFLASRLSQPLLALTRASQKIARGELGQQVAIEGDDEIGQLATSFNAMSQEVARVNQQRKQMTADIAHDLRTPLTVIAGYVESMRDGVLQPTPARLGLIYAEIERLQNLVGDLKMLSQVDAGELPLHPQLVAPHLLLEHSAEIFHLRAEQQMISIGVDAPENLPLIKVDEARMAQVFANLLSNALRYTPQGGQILLSATAENQYVILAIADNGTGISEGDLANIFERFHRVDKSRHTESGESGLGLAIVKALVEAHGGSVQAESQPGVGTKVMITLPVASNPPV